MQIFREEGSNSKRVLKYCISTIVWGGGLRPKRLTMIMLDFKEESVMSVVHS